MHHLRGEISRSQTSEWRTPRTWEPCHVWLSPFYSKKILLIIVLRYVCTHEYGFVQRWMIKIELKFNWSNKESERERESGWMGNLWGLYCYDKEQALLIEVGCCSIFQLSKFCRLGKFVVCHGGKFLSSSKTFFFSHRWSLSASIPMELRWYLHHINIIQLPSQ